MFHAFLGSKENVCLRFEQQIRTQKMMRSSDGVWLCGGVDENIEKVEMETCVEGAKVGPVHEPGENIILF